MSSVEQLASVWGLARSLLIYHALPWRRRSLRQFYAGLIAPGALVFDIGAHVGNCSRTLVGLGAHCIAVEPQPLCLTLLERTIGRQSAVTLVKTAVGARCGTATLRVSRRHPTVSTLSTAWIDQVATAPGFRRVRWNQCVPVPVTTLDALIDTYGLPAFCKIDVEGLEADILAGLSRPIPLIAFEYLPAAPQVAAGCIDELARIGAYRFNRSTGEQHRLALEQWIDAGRMRQWIARLPADARSGDIYARLIDSAPGRLPASDTSP